MNWKARFFALVAGVLSPDRRAVTVALVLFLTLFSAAVGMSQQNSAVLVVQSNPGGVQVYVDDELRGATSQLGRLRISTLRPGKHSLRLSLSGYQDWQQEISLVAGHTVTRTATLGQAGAKQDDGPPLEDTLQWVKNALSSDGGRGFFMDGGKCTIRNELDHESSCDVVFVEYSSCTNASRSTIALNLSELDFSSVKIRNPPDVQGVQWFGLMVYAETANLSKTIKTSKNGGPPTTDSHLVLSVSSEEVGKRLAKALSHAVTLCGDKSSVF